jgi:organic hydroperoxide reductase OsmC/OhrA
MQCLVMKVIRTMMAARYAAHPPSHRRPTMTNYVADVIWTLKDGEEFSKGQHRCTYSVAFDGGTIIQGSASPHIVGKWADSTAIDPEEMLVAALSSCHMLTFFHFARLAGFEIVSYRDHAEGMMAEVAPGKLAMSRVTLQPNIEWAGPGPHDDHLAQLHREAHEACFIANSVRTEVVIAPRSR